MKAFLDTCVLYPPLVRALLLDAAGAGLYQPFWSPRVLAEWQISIGRKQGAERETEVLDAQDRIAARFPTALVVPDPEIEITLDLPDPADNHVLAGAIAAGADALVTFNLRDFPQRTLAGHGIAPRHPDGFLWELLSMHPDRMRSALTGTLSGFEIDPDAARAPLKRARLPRFGKAWVAGTS